MLFLHFPSLLIFASSSFSSAPTSMANPVINLSICENEIGMSLIALRLRGDLTVDGNSCQSPSEDFHRASPKNTAFT